MRSQAQSQALKQILQQQQRVSWVQRRELPQGWRQALSSQYQQQAQLPEQAWRQAPPQAQMQLPQEQREQRLQLAPPAWQVREASQEMQRQALELGPHLHQRMRGLRPLELIWARLRPCGHFSASGASLAICVATRYARLRPHGCRRGQNLATGPCAKPLR